MCGYLVDRGDALGVGHRQQLADAQGEVLGERRHSRADDRDLPHDASLSGWNAYP